MLPFTHSRRGTSSGIVPKLTLSVFADLRLRELPLFIPFTPLRSPVVESNPYILLLWSYRHRYPEA